MTDPPSPWAPRPPSRFEVEAQFRGVLDGTLTRDQVDRWAARWVAAPGDAGVEDEVVWTALNRLFGINGPHPPDEFIISDEEVRDWLVEFLNAP